MRNITFITLLIAGSITLAQAQTLIPKAGVTIASIAAETRMDGDGITSTTDYGNQAGFTLGLGYNVPVTAFGSVMLSLQPEFNYIQKGYTSHTEGEFQLDEAYYHVTGKSKFTLNYVEIPVLAKFEYGAGNIKVALYAGPSLGFALGGKYKTTIASDDGGETVSKRYSGKIRFYDSDEENEISFDHNIDFGLQGGAAVTLLNRIMLDIRYGTALTDLIHDQKTKNKAMQFTIGVPISIQIWVWIVEVWTACLVCFVDDCYFVNKVFCTFTIFDLFACVDHRNEELLTSCQYFINKGPISKFAFNFMLVVF